MNITKWLESLPYDHQIEFLNLVNVHKIELLAAGYTEQEASETAMQAIYDQRCYEIEASITGLYESRTIEELDADLRAMAEQYGEL